MEKIKKNTFFRFFRCIFFQQYYYNSMKREKINLIFSEKTKTKDVNEIVDRFGGNSSCQCCAGS